jgi:hypothetical protein
VEQSPRDYRLFHCTDSLGLRGILRDHGFWPKFLAENFTWMWHRPAFIAFPVVCFCDIPMRALSKHRARYGQYMLAMSKMWSLGRDINPVWYVQPGSSVYCHFGQVVQNPPGFTLSTIPDSVKPLPPFLKLTAGDQADRSRRHPGQCELLAFEEEMEWRHTPRCLMDRWIFGRDRSIGDAADHELSKPFLLQLDHKDIDSIYVPTKADREGVIAEFSALSGKVEVLP